MNELKKKYKYELMKYGFLPLLFLQHKYEMQEKYEACNAIKETLEEHAKEYSIEIPKKLDENAVEEAAYCFWKMGMSGDTYLANIPYYAYEIEKSVKI